MKSVLSFVLFLCAIQLSKAQDVPSYPSSTFSFPVSNLEASIQWYQEVLGNMERFSPAEGVVECLLNETTWLQLFEAPSGTGAILRLEVTDIKQHHKRLSQLDIVLTPVELVPGVVSYFDFKDLDGNLLSFYELEQP